MTYDMIKAVLNRPEMYTLTGDYNEVCAFLEGYYSGIAKVGFEFEGKYEWSLFLEWLSQKNLESDSQSIVKAFKQANYKDPLEKFRENYLDYLSSKSPLH
ncbi:MAG: hypothetical protein AAF902_23425 [Chloroflexota bacterium]